MSIRHKAYLQYQENVNKLKVNNAGFFSKEDFNVMENEIKKENS